MLNRKMSSIWIISGFLLLLVLFCVPANADEAPDSPVPVLLSDIDASRVLAVESARYGGRLPKTAQKAFRVGKKTEIILFIRNLALLEGEGANAVRVYLNHSNGRKYQLQVEDLTPAGDNLHALYVRLHDWQGYRGQPPANGDALIYVTWRGLASNQLKIGLGRTGGEVKIPEAEKIAYQQSIEDLADESSLYHAAGDRVRFMEQAAFGPSPALDLRLRQIGLRRWINGQFEEQYPTLAYPNLQPMPSAPPPDCTRMTNPSCYRENYTMHPLQQWFFKEAFYGNAQLRHRVTWSLSQIWVTSGVTIQQSSQMLAYQKALAKHAFGNYRELMQEITLNPTMGDYLDMARSTKVNPNENYPREILQLFSIGLFMLNQDGTLQLDTQGQPIPTYNQNTINNLSKVFTGWTFCNSTCENSQTGGIVNYRDPMILIPSNHDTTAKTLLTYPNVQNPNIPACANCTTPENTTAYANASLNQTLDNIFNHPNTAPYVSKLLIQHLVTSDPSPAYVGRVAAAFNNNGAGRRGDMKAIIAAVLLDPEARGSIKTAPRYGKLREPVQLVTNLARLFNVKSYNREELSDGSLSPYTGKIGQEPFNSPTVFNYYPPDYIVPGTTLLAPEFGLLNAGSSASRLNLIYLLVFDGITPGGAEVLRGTSLDLSDLTQIAQADASSGQLVDHLNNKMMHGVMSDAHRTSILTAVNAVPASNPLLRAKTAVYLIAASSQYQVQR